MFVALLLSLLLTGVAASASVAPPYRIRRQDGAWSLVAPDGGPMFSLGVCCVGMGDPREKYNPQKPGYAAWRQYREPLDWADATLRRLKSWGFRTIGGWSDYETLRRSKQMDLAFVPVLHLGASTGAPWFDMWDPAVISKMDAVAREQILPLRDDSRLLGYYTDNEMGWWNAALWKMTLEQPSRSGQRQRLVRMLRDQYHGDWSELLKEFEPEGASSFGQLDTGGVLYLRPGGDGIRVMRRFLGIAARRYYQLTRQIIRRYDRRALILGDRYQSFYYPEVARACASAVDAVSTNLNANWSDGTFTRFYLDTLYALARRPIMVGEFYMSATENRSGNRNSSSGFPVVATQRERAEGFRRTLSAIARMPFVIGADWFQYYDEPTFGRDDGENYNMGLVDINDRPYREITAAASSMDLPRLRASGPAQRADAAAGVPPAPAEPMTDLRPLQILKNWDRERGFIRPRSRYPIADLYLCWAPDAVYLGLYAMDPPEETYYRDGKIPEADRIEWTLQVGQASPIRVRLGAGRAPSVDNPGVTVASPARPGDVRTVAIMKLPASITGRPALRPGDRFPFTSTLLSLGRAYRVDWSGDYRLAR
jgi:hypothetical protein